MSNAYRLDQIYSYLMTNKSATVEELSQSFRVTPMTIRRDLLVLEEKGLINRRRGSAQIIESQVNTGDFFQDEKRRIARKAAEFITEDMAILLDSGTTTGALVDYMLERDPIKNVNFVTHSLSHAIHLSSKYSVSIPGGAILPESHFIICSDVEGFYRSVNADLAFLGSTGVYNCSGLTIGYPIELGSKKASAQCSQKRIGMMNSSKYYRRGIYVFCDFQDLDTLITVETEENRPELDRISKLGTEIILV